MTTQPVSWVGSRRLLRQLRDLMKGGSGGQERLDRVVHMIADDMVAEVCSLYVRRPGEVLELFATWGLRPEAVHRTRLAVGEGIVGAVASSGRPLALSDAQSHPNFAYRPETGEEIFHSMLGVPVLRDGRVVGVLAVQNKTQRSYTDDEVEALETVAMVLAETIAAGELIGGVEGRHLDTASTLPARLSGVVLNEGIGMGEAVPHERGIVIRQVVAEDSAAELERLDAALAAMLEALDDLMTRRELAEAGESLEVFETYRMFAQDRGWLERIREAIRGGLTAEAAVQRVQRDTRQRMAKVRDPYIRERYADLDDLGNRLLQHLLRAEGGAEGPVLPENSILVARALGPAELLDYDAKRLKGVILEEGSPTAHVAIVARALGIPMVGRCSDLLTRVKPGDFVVCDGDTGQVLLRPRLSVRQSFSDAIEARARRRASFALSRDLPAETLDGVRVSLQINAGLLIDVPQLHEAGAEGIGLYRTEVPFMVREAFPDVGAQTQLYARILELAKDRPVTFRTLDIGGDKALPYWHSEVDENPIMGWRAIRIGLDRPALLSQQLRALVRAAAGRHLRVMFPMVSEVSEFVRARALLDREVERQVAAGGEPPARLQAGVMLEVPALVWQLPALFKRVDFISVGSNDLFQFLFATDRGNPRLARRYDVLSPPSLAFLRSVAGQAGAAGVPLSLCGEMAGHPLEAMALVGCGFRILSMPAAEIGPVRTTIRSLELAPLERLLDRLMEQPARSVREQLRAYARDRGVAI
ncbi:phosphotransferase system, enzyme I, PtsP [Tistlia consotensis]|uniref:phosphoenolpyruvate--protein phosphotransferase n=1 Tax=Tistlia consotensis USBA 355 TaxID=560819 RepID=A0A1Y6BZP6_9PROT|nr:phosphoenolpyruvate--protein phosphotransferase [Tistlia consotensis]SMF33716.1 phosphotransferase system, enzyme I, PtsP [Tistlia consotensis USBA 355]SNR70195.1 phosphotransferase system, enzyme I, PtsP [Tistlia consotensis]